MSAVDLLLAVAEAAFAMLAAVVAVLWLVRVIRRSKGGTNRDNPRR